MDAAPLRCSVSRANKRLIEYTGERVSHEVADARYDAEEAAGNTHTVLFAIDAKMVIDAGVGGNDAGSSITRAIRTARRRSCVAACT